MLDVLREGLDLAQQLAALPFKAARHALRETSLSRRPLGEVVADSLMLGEGLAKLPFQATAALMAEMGRSGPSLEERVANLERRLGASAEPSPPMPEPPPQPDLAVPDPPV